MPMKFVSLWRSEDSAKSVPAFDTNAAFSWLRFWLRFGSGFGDDQEVVTVADDHYGRQEMLHDFNGIVSIGLTRSSSAVTA